MSDQEHIDIEQVIDEMAIEVRPPIKISPDVRRFAEVMEELAPNGRRVRVRDLVDKTVVIRHIRFFRGQYGFAAYCILTDEDGELLNVVFGQQVILPKLAAIRDYLPVEVRVVKRERAGTNGYYDLE